MSTKHKWRIAYIFTALVIISIIVALVVYALRQNINLFFTPQQLLAQSTNATVRLGGQVAPHSVKHSEALAVNFIISDTKASIPVHYQGILPDLFREGQGVVAKGQLRNGVFYAEQILAKHDQYYIPPGTEIN